MSVFEHYKILMPPCNLISCCDVFNPKLGQESTSIGKTCTSCTNDYKRIKIIIYRNFEANILTSKYKFHKFWNVNSSSNIIIAKIGSKKAQTFISYAKGDRRIKIIPKWNQTNISNIIYGRNIKTRSPWTFRRNVFMKAIFLKIPKLRHFLWRFIPKVLKMSWSECPWGINI